MSTKSRIWQSGRQGLVAAAFVGLMLAAGQSSVLSAQEEVPLITQAPLTTLELVSVSSDEVQGNGASGNNNIPSAVSDDGRYVVFQSSASNLVPGDTNGHRDIFVRDRQTGTTERVSVSTGGTQGNDGSINPDISGDGRYVVFLSYANNLVPGAVDTDADIFVRDRVAGTTRQVIDVGWSGEDAVISGNGRYVTFHTYAALLPSDGDGARDIYVVDLQTNGVEHISRGADRQNGHSFSPSISDDGRYIAYHSLATDLVPGDTNFRMDIFVYDRLAGTTARASVATGGAQANNDSLDASISNDGRYVSFNSEATNLSPLDPNANYDIYVRDLQAGTTELASVTSDEVRPPALAASLDSSISGDGRYVAFQSDLPLDPADTRIVSDIYVRDRVAGTTEWISKPGNSYSWAPSISTDGRFVVFGSAASNLVSIDTNDTYDIFLADRAAAPPTSCPVQFSDVPPGSTFYPYVRCLACRGILGGYIDGTFRPGNPVTRGQLSKIVSSAAGYNEAVSGQTFIDVAPGSTFYEYVERMARRGIIGGYTDGTFRPGNTATRGQISKIVSSALGFNEPISGQTFTDVPPGSTFYEFIERMASRGIIGGYTDGTFRPGNNATRGQVAKIVSSAFFPGCQTP